MEISVHQFNCLKHRVGSRDHVLFSQRQDVERMDVVIFLKLRMSQFPIRNLEVRLFS